MLEYLIEQITFFAVMYEYGNFKFTPTDCMNCQNAGGFTSTSGPCTLGNGKVMYADDQNEMLARAQSSLYLSIMLCQMWNLFACKCKLRSPFTTFIFKNHKTWWSVIGGASFAFFVVYAPFMNIAFGTSYHLEFVYLLIPLFGGSAIFFYAALRRVVLMTFNPITFTPEPLGLQMHPTKWSRA